MGREGEAPAAPAAKKARPEPRPPRSQGGRGPHSIHISPYDPERNVWVIDDWQQQIFVFSNDGKRLVRTFGEAGVEGNDEKHFGRPTGIAWLPDGSFFVADGYTNSRVMKFDKDGKFLTAWGTRGSKPGEFQVPHSIAVDRARRVFVARCGISAFADTLFCSSRCATRCQNPAHCLRFASTRLKLAARRRHVRHSAGHAP